MRHRKMVSFPASKCKFKSIYLYEKSGHTGRTRHWRMTNKYIKHNEKRISVSVKWSWKNGDKSRVGYKSTNVISKNYIAWRAVPNINNPVRKAILSHIEITHLTVQLSYLGEMSKAGNGKFSLKLQIFLMLKYRKLNVKFCLHFYLFIIRPVSVDHQERRVTGHFGHKTLRHQDTSDPHETL